MRLTELKALDKLVKSDKTYDFLQHVFVSGNLVYASTPYIVVEIRCKELTDNYNNFAFVPIDMEKAIESNANNNYVELEKCGFVDDYSPWVNWGTSYFSRCFDTKVAHHVGRYNPKYIIDILRIFKAFKINVGFVYNEATDIVTFEGFNSNYEIRALLMPIK